jgi:hypothetical protein
MAATDRTGVDMNKRTILPLFLLLVSASAATAVVEQDRLLDELYGKGRFDEAAARCDSLLGHEPDAALLNHFKGRILADQYRFAEAVPYLERAAAADTALTWIYAWCQVYLGVCRYGTGDDEGARRAWNEACEVDATKNATATAKLYLTCLVDDEPYAAWTVRDTEHFEFRFSPLLENVDVDSFTRLREEAFVAIAAWFGREPGRRIRFYVWSSNEEAQKAGLPNLGFSRSQVSLIHSLANQTLGHEMTHVIANQAVPPRRPSGLISEGAAIFHDQRLRDRIAVARSAWSTLPVDRRPHLFALWEDWRLLDVDVSYPVAGAFVAMLVTRGGREKFLELFQEQTPDAARRVYGPDFDGWVADFMLLLASQE